VNIYSIQKSLDDVFGIEHIPSITNKEIQTIPKEGQILHTTSGFEGMRHTEETKKRMSEQRKGRDIAWGDKISKGLLKSGFKHTKEHKIHIGNVHRGKSVSKETRLKQSLAKIGKKHSEESKRKMSEAQKGRKHSKESKRKMSEAQKGTDHWSWIAHTYG